MAAQQHETGDRDRLEKVQIRSELVDRVVVETPWARPCGADRYALENIPWWAGAYSWGDVVRCEQREPDGFPEVVERLRAGGHTTLRVLFHPLTTPETQDLVLDALVEQGATYEGTGGAAHGFYAVDVAPEVAAEPIERHLAQAEGDGLLSWQRGGTAEFLGRCDAAFKLDNWTLAHSHPLDPDGAQPTVMVDVTANRGTDRRWELLWARPEADGWTVVNAPFLAYDLAAGDRVETRAEPGRYPTLERIVARSGRYTLRAVPLEIDGEQLVAEVERRGARAERHPRGGRMIAIDAPSWEAAEEAYRWLAGLEQQGAADFETGWR